MTLDDRQIILTGAAGFIGSCLVRHFNDQGFDNLILVDDLGSDDKWFNLVGKKFREILPIQSLPLWLLGRQAEIQGIIHLGACSNTLETNADYLLENNYRYSQKLAEWAVENDVRFIYASSAATYGDGSKGFSDDHGLLQDLKPLNMYGYSKHLFDLWAQHEGILDQIVGLKYFNVFGPNEWHKGRMSSAIVKFVDSIKKEGKLSLFASSEPKKFKDGDQVRDFLYVKDAVKMTAAFLENDAGGIFNIGAGKAETWNTLADATFGALNLPAKIEYVPMPSDLIGKYQNYTKAEMEKATIALDGKVTTRPLKESVFDYVRNHLLTHTFF
jgi:ADP-L-glycero-D-manno-heptose 6-epimerase